MGGVGARQVAGDEQPVGAGQHGAGDLGSASAQPEQFRSHHRVCIHERLPSGRLRVSVGWSLSALGTLPAATPAREPVTQGDRSATGGRSAVARPPVLRRGRAERHRRA
ncbi:hypothetical protein MILUP08_45562 [Micromonospora lupini str. Lupac 08]|uniref:Uncharacterized protein n=1 Tax=Micromonospora lupini str. Lupac 08 TaxID=1150864 RepID=I0LA31_9ACTN|nr:hypothetical protein MILUP08_45562 [Micromonospora lupini str. Lupac 08]